MKLNNRGQANDGGIQGIFMFIGGLIVLGVMVLIIVPIFDVVWNLNENAPNYNITRVIIDMWPLLLLVGFLFWYFFIQPNQNQYSN